MGYVCVSVLEGAARTKKGAIKGGKTVGALHGVARVLIQLLGEIGGVSRERTRGKAKQLDEQHKV